MLLSLFFLPFAEIQSPFFYTLIFYFTTNIKPLIFTHTISNYLLYNNLIYAGCFVSMGEDQEAKKIKH